VNGDGSMAAAFEPSCFTCSYATSTTILSPPLAHSKVFPAMVTRMISVGEKTGELEKMLAKIADFYENEVDAAVTALTSLIEPLVIAILGVVIGGIVIALFMPIFQLPTMIK